MLDERTKELVAVGASITANCQPCLEYHTAKARELGAATEDILAAIDIGKQVRRGAAAKMDRFAAEHVAGEAVSEPAAGCECQ
jgi:AhpD family alkylhydroperoxidase